MWSSAVCGLIRLEKSAIICLVLMEAKPVGKTFSVLVDRLDDGLCEVDGGGSPTSRGSPDCGW